jgi:hypothetical protein
VLLLCEWRFLVVVLRCQPKIKWKSIWTCSNWKVREVLWSPIRAKNEAGNIEWLLFFVADQYVDCNSPLIGVVSSR